MSKQSSSEASTFENAPLAGISVVDLSQYIPGPYTTLKLLELGAEVTKVEPIGGEPMRYFGIDPAPESGVEVKNGQDAQDVTPVYRYLNQGKQVVELDLKQTAGKAHLTTLLETADVLVAGFRPGVLDRLGFSQYDLKLINPKLIICHIGGFEADGPRAKRGGHDIGYAACAGLYTPKAGAKPAVPAIIFPPVADHAGALQALALINAALFRLAKTGQGSTVNVSLFSAVDDWRYIFKSENLRQLLGGDAACYNLYLTSDDKLISLGAIESKFWLAFCEGVNYLSWIPRQHEALPQVELIKELTALFSSQPLRYWQDLLRNVDCCFERVISHAEAAQDLSDKAL